MAYERYIRKGGKIYGPYTYHSKKKNGKVVSEYIGKDIEEIIKKKKDNSTKKIWYFIGILSVLILLLFIFFLNTTLTGKASLEIENTYIDGEKIVGSVKLILKQGEFLPASTKVIIDNSGTKSEYLLNELISESTSEGKFYIEDKEITGTGEGFGVEGEKITYPEVDFTLKISEIAKETGKNEEKSETTQEQTPAIETQTVEVKEKTEKETKKQEAQQTEQQESITAETTEAQQETTSEAETQTEVTESQESTITETSSSPITGEAVSETSTEIHGKVSKDKPYTYQLSEEQTAGITSSSQEVKLKIKDNVAEITTDYSEKEKGFGKDYLTSEARTINIDLTSLGLTAKEGILSISLNYNEQELVSASKTISVEKEVVLEQNETLIEQNITIISNISTSNETIIEITTGNATINTIQYGAVLDKPVKWKKNIKLDNAGESIIVEIPKEAENITVYKISDDEQKEELNDVVITGGLKEEDVEAQSSIITGNVVEIQEKTEVTEVNIVENSTEFEIEYETPAPIAFETDTLSGKEIIISGPEEIHYENILAFTELPQEVPEQLIKLYHLVTPLGVPQGGASPQNTELGGNDSKILVDFDSYDTNNNSLIDYIEWLVPSLSNQTYELEITILNVQSYPSVGGNWIVEFTTLGTANLTISAVNGTTWSNEDGINDLKFIEIKCGDSVLSYQWLDNSVFVSDYSCNTTGSETSKVITQGKHHLEFDFGGFKAYAHNSASAPIPQTINIHGKLTNSTGSAINGTYNMTFKIYDASTGGNLIWTSVNNSVSVDSNGVYNHILSPINFSFNGDYYLGISVGNDSEMTPRINLTSTPYTFRANVSDTLDVSKNYQVANLTVSDKITFAFGELIDNLVDGWLRITGGLNITGNVIAGGNVTAQYYFGNGSSLTGVCLANGSNCQITSDTQKTTLSIYLYNDTSTIYFNETQLNTTIDRRASAFNETQIILDNNASWLSTYNATYEGSVNNASYLSTYNATYAGLIDNASYLSTYNATYDAYVTANQSNNTKWLDGLNWTSNSWYSNWYNHTSAVNTLWGMWFYNQTTPAITDINSRFWNRTQSYNKTEIDNFNSSWLSTYNSTYAGLMDNASYLSTYNATYDAYVTANYTNKSNYWDNLNTPADILGSSINNNLNWINFTNYTNLAWTNQSNDFNNNSITNVSYLNVTSGLTDTSLSAGSVLFVKAGGLISQNNSALYWNSSLNFLGVRTTSPNAPIDIRYGSTPAVLPNGNIVPEGIFAGITSDETTLSYARAGMFVLTDNDNGSAMNSNRMGLNAFVFKTGNGTSTRHVNDLGYIGGRYGIRPQPTSAMGGNVNHSAAVVGEFTSTANYLGTFTNHRGFHNYIVVGGGTITNAYGIQIDTPSKTGSGAITNNYGIWIKPQTAGDTINSGIVLAGDGVGADLVLGEGQDANIYWDGNNLVLNTTRVSNGNTTFTGNVDLRNGNLTINNKICNTTACFTLSELNASYSGSTYNATYAGLIDNASYLSTYNATYDAKISFNNTNISYLNNTNQVFTGINNFSQNISVSDTVFSDKIKSISGNILFYNNTGSENVRISNDGKIGVGMNSPLASVDIAKGTQVTAPVGTAAADAFRSVHYGNASVVRAGLFASYDVTTANNTNSFMGFNAFIYKDNIYANTGSTGYVVGRYGFRMTSAATGGNITNANVIYTEFTPASQYTGTITNARGLYMTAFTDGGGYITNADQIVIEKQTVGTARNSGILLNGDGAGADILFGAGQDANIYWDGNNLVLNTTKVSNGNATFTGGVNLASGMNYSVGSSVGINGNYSVGSCWIKFTGGIATSTNCTSA